MSRLPATDASLLVRTDFSDESSWAGLLQELSRETADGFRAYVEVVDDRRWEDAAADSVRRALPETTGAAVLFVADRLTLATAEHPVVVLDLWGERAPFRCVATELWGPDNNLNIGNMGFSEFADAAGTEGVFRGFPPLTS